MKKMKTSILAAFLLIMVGALMVGGATVAWFTSQAENNDNSFAAGTLEISLDKPNGTKYFNISNIAPGDSGSTRLTVSNTGTLEFRYSFSLTEEGGLFDGDTPMVITVKDSEGKVVDLGASRTLDSDEDETFTVYWSMPSAAGNSYQKQSGTLGISVLAEQTAAP